MPEILETCAACWQSRPAGDMGTLIPPPPVKRVRICRECISALWNLVHPMAEAAREEIDP